MENKICVYTVCAETAQFVDKWYSSVSEADRIVAIVHDTKDTTSEKMIEYGVDVVFTYYKEYSNEKGRNDALKWAKKYAPECNIFAFVPVENVFDPGWSAMLREAWKPEYDFCYFKIIHDNNEFSTTKSNWIHSNSDDWIWDENGLKNNNAKNFGDLFDRIVMYNSNISKRSKNYLSILKNWLESSETPSPECLRRYSDELLRQGEDKEAYKLLSEHIDKCSKDDKVALYYNGYLLANLAKHFGDDDKVLEYIKLAESSGIKTRSLQMLKAIYEAEVNGDYEKALEEALDSYSCPEENFKFEVLKDNGDIEEAIAFYFCQLKKYDGAFKFSTRALQFQPDNEEFKKNHEIYRRLNTNKICVYTTCYNESKFIEKWLDNNKDADHIVVLIHDCKDDSEEKFKKAANKDGPPISIGYGFYTDWRFDRGKNDSKHLAYSLAPECNIFVFTSLDEYWDPGWAEEVKRNWIPEETQQCWYNFVQSHDDFGNDTGTTWFNWMISKDPKWHWEYPIHEAILYGDREPIKGINLFNTVKLQHWPDYGKPRNYLPLHRMRWEEYGNDISCLYLIRESIIQREFDEAYKLAKNFNFENTDLNLEEGAYIMVMQGICCEQFERFDEAVALYKKASERYSNYRTPLVRLGVIYTKIGAYSEAERVFKKAFDETTNIFSWVNDPWDWRSKPFFWMSQIKLETGNIFEALGYALFASQVDAYDDQKENYQKIFDLCLKS